MRQILCVLMLGLTTTAGCGDDTGDGAGRDGGSPGADAAASPDAGGGGVGSKDCATDEGKLSVDIDGVRTETCMTMLSAGGLNHAFGTLDNGDSLIINFTGQVPDEGVCVGIGVRKADNSTTMNDWMSGAACDVDIQAYGASGQRVQGTFSATVKPSNGNTDPALELTDGSFDVVRP